MLRVVMLATVPIALWGLSSDQPSASDAEAIKETALDYGQGWYEGNAERMERALHPDLAKRRLAVNPRSGKGRIDHIGAMGLVQATRKAYGAKTPVERRRTDVTILDVFGNAANVKLEMHDWIDYLHMVKTDGRWVIINVLWELTPEAKKRHGT